MNMTFTQLQDVFDHIKQVHYRAGECCARAKNTADERLNLLEKFFGRWEDRLGHCLESLENEGEETLLDTWVQFPGTDNVDHALAEVCRAQSESPDTLIEKSLAIKTMGQALLPGSDHPRDVISLLIFPGSTNSTTVPAVPGCSPGESAPNRDGCLIRNTVRKVPFPACRLAAACEALLFL